MKISFLKRIKPNNRYNYTPRYYKGKDDNNPYEFSTKLDKYYETYNKNDFGAHWRDVRHEKRNRSNVEINKTVLIIAVALLLIFFWIIDFDLSIFTS